MAKLDYIKEAVIKRNPNDVEFIQAVDEVLLSLEKVAEKHPEYIKKVYLSASLSQNVKSSSVCLG